MRHARKEQKLSRTTSHRRAMLRNLVTSLFMHERVTTSVAKAKVARRYAERMITFAKRGDLHARRQVARFVNDPETVQKLFTTIAPWYTERHGGYTRILKTGPRLGDAGQMALFELVKSKEQLAAERAAREKAGEAGTKKKVRRGLPSFGRRKKPAGEGEPEATAAAGTEAAPVEKKKKAAPKKKAAVKKAAGGTKKKAEGTATKKAATKKKPPSKTKKTGR